MKYFVGVIIAFFFPLLTVALCGEYILRNIPNVYSFKGNFLKHNASDIKVLILGNSHAYEGVDPRYISSNAFNAAGKGQTLYIDYEVLIKYGRLFNNLKCIVLPVDFFSIHYKPDDTYNSDYAIYYGIYTSTTDINNYSQILSKTLYHNVNLLYKYYYKKSVKISCSNKGWSDEQDKATDMAKSGKKSVSAHFRYGDEFVNTNTEILHMILLYAEIKKIKVFLITPPAYSTYTNDSIIANNKNKLQGIISLLLKTHANAFYHNFLSDTSFYISDFTDADHLNEVGAKKFTLKIDSLLKKNHVE